MQNVVENKIDEACNELARVLKEKNKYFCLDSEIVIKGDKKNVK